MNRAAIILMLAMRNYKALLVGLGMMAAGVVLLTFGHFSRPKT